MPRLPAARAAAIYFVLLVAISGIPSAALAAHQSGHSIAGTRPLGRSDPGVAYDVDRDELVVFGGFSSFGDPPRYAYLDDTWTWNPTPGWIRQNPISHPRKGNGFAMAYDKVRGYTVLFGGGNDNGVSSETWLWDGTRWIKAHPTTSPPPTLGGRAVFDPVLGRVVVLAGDGNNPGTTWSWDGADWIQEAPPVGPDARQWAAGAFDESDGTFVIFGGSWWCGEVPCVLGDTWTWNGAQWNQQSPPASPSRRSGAAAAYNSIEGRVVLFGGWNFAYYNDTWTWDGANWRSEDPATSPRQRASAALVFDDALGEVLLFGGGIVLQDNRHYSFNDLWAWDGTTWTRMG